MAMRKKPKATKRASKVKGRRKTATKATKRKAPKRTARKKDEEE